MKNLKIEVRKFNQLQEQHKDSGASDSLSDMIFQGIMMKAASGKVAEVPFNANGWTLYEAFKGREDVAQKLSEQARKVVKEIGLARKKDLKKFTELSEKLCWRYFPDKLISSR